MLHFVVLKLVRLVCRVYNSCFVVIVSSVVTLLLFCFWLLVVYLVCFVFIVLVRLSGYIVCCICCVCRLFYFVFLLVTKLVFAGGFSVVCCFMVGWCLMLLVCDLLVVLILDCFCVLIIWFEIYMLRVEERWCWFYCWLVCLFWFGVSLGLCLWDNLCCFWVSDSRCLRFCSFCKFVVLKFSFIMILCVIDFWFDFWFDLVFWF